METAAPLLTPLGTPAMLTFRIGIYIGAIERERHDAEAGGADLLASTKGEKKTWKKRPKNRTVNFGHMLPLPTTKPFQLSQGVIKQLKNEVTAREECLENVTPTC